MQVRRWALLLGLVMAPCAGAAAAKGTPKKPEAEKGSQQRGPGATPSSHATAPRSETPAARPWVGLAVGPAFPFNQGPVWMRAQVRVGLPLARLDDNLSLSLVLPLSAGRARESGAFASTSTVLGMDLLPSARLGLRGPGALGFYADFGAGVAHFRYHFEIDGLGEGNATSTGLGLRLAAGVTYGLGQRWQLFVEPLHVLFHTAQEGVFRFGNTSFTSSTGAGTQASTLAGAAFTW